MKMSGKTRYKVRYMRASTDLYRWGELHRDVYVQKYGKGKASLTLASVMMYFE